MLTVYFIILHSIPTCGVGINKTSIGAIHNINTWSMERWTVLCFEQGSKIIFLRQGTILKLNSRVREFSKMKSRVYYSSDIIFASFDVYWIPQFKNIILFC